MAKKKLTQEELLVAFNRYMPKRPIYPPLVQGEEVLLNSSTESEGSDNEEEDPRKKFRISSEFSAVMTDECRQAYENSSIKPPAKYLRDNVKHDLDEALQKLVNLKIKPKDPIDWLGYYLLNMNVRNEGRVRKQDFHVKPTGEQLDFKIEADFEVHTICRLSPPVLFQEAPSREAHGPAKRKHSPE